MGTSHTSPGKPNYRGLDLEKHLASGRGRTFSDIPLIELAHWPVFVWAVVI